MLCIIISSSYWAAVETVSYTGNEDTFEVTLADVKMHTLHFMLILSLLHFINSSLESSIYWLQHYP